MKYRILLIINILINLSLVAGAESREKLASISGSVGAEGNFSFWTEGSAPVAALKDFVADVCDPQSAAFVKPEERVAVFDMDGTLLCETAPSYFEWMMYIRRVLYDGTYSPSRRERKFAERFEAAIRSGHTPGAEFSRQAELECNAFKGLTLNEFADYVRGFMDTPVEGYEGLKWGEAVYIPMLEVVAYLAANDFRVYIVSGSERHGLRVYCDGILRVEPSHIIGTDIDFYTSGQGSEDPLTYRMQQGETIHRGGFTIKNLNTNKVTSIVREIGVQPILAFGNAASDFSMFNHATTGNPHRSMAFCVVPDDTVRESGKPAKAESLRQTCAQNGWVSISMKDDWKTIYGDSVKKR